MYLYWGHSASMSLRKGSSLRKQQKMSWKGERAVKKMMSVTQILLFFFLQLNLYFFLVSRKALIILQRAIKRAHPRKSLPTYQKQLYNICTKMLQFHYFLNLGCLYTFVCLKIHLCLNIWFSTSFDITWFDEAVIYAENLLFSHSIVS